jgi:nitroreductase
MLGLGACWLGVHPREERIAAVRGLFNLPEGILPVAGISLGWPAEDKEPRTRFNAALVHFEQW